MEKIENKEKLRGKGRVKRIGRDGGIQERQDDRG